MQRNRLVRLTVYPRVRLALFGAFILACSLPLLALSVQAAPAPIYISPRPGASLVSPGTTIALRWGPEIDAASVRDGLFQVEGSQSGYHTGRVSLSDDHSTIIFRPYLPFAPAEKVSVNLSAGLRSTAAESFGGVSFEFHISPQAAPQKRLPISDLLATETSRAPAQVQAPATNQIVSNYLTLPADFPNYTVTVPANGTGDGDLFLAPFSTIAGLRPYLLIIDNSGQPVYYQPMVTSTLATDFKRQPNGQLTYYDGSLGYFVALDNAYNIVNTYATGNGYSTDLHELQVLSNSHALLMSYDPQGPINMSSVGGSPTATVIGLIVQELDTAKNVEFEWRSWDHFNITDTTEPLTDSLIDYVHGNAIELDQDGNLLISSRHLDEITKINLQTGDIIWRMGGKNNQFTFINDSSYPFAHQHDIRRLPNGNITLLDNHNGLQPQYSRAVEYQLDEASKHAKLVWQYPNTPDHFVAFMGSNQRLPNGNSVTGWGSNSAPSVIEAKPDNSKAFELELQSPFVSYRAFRFPWQGFPTADPTLVVTSTGATTTLAYSWNGATEIGSYRIYGGDSVYPSTLLAVQPKTGFEDKTVLVGLQGLYCYFRVMPLDKGGRETRYSNEAHLTPPCQPQKKYFPWVAN